MSNIAIETLLKERQRLIDEKERIVSQLNKEIGALETAIETIEGERVWETTPPLIYDDESPDYIRSSQEEI